MAPNPTPTERHDTANALMDATERLLVREGHARVATRRVTDEADQAHGLVRYHFGSLEGLMLATLERATASVIDRQRALYEGDGPFIDKWRTAMELYDADLVSGYPKVVAELLAKAWNEPVYREGLGRVMASFTEVLTEAVESAADEYGVEVDDPVAAATLIRTFQLGMLMEALAGIEVGHDRLRAAIDRALVAARPEAEGEVGDASPTA